MKKTFVCLSCKKAEYISQYKGEVPPGIDTQEDVIRAEEYLKI